MYDVQSAAGLQTELLGLWRRLLQNDAITPDDDFFDMGGDSLLAAELIVGIERVGGRSIPESLLFEASTVRQVMQRLQAHAVIAARTVIEVGPVGDANPLLFFHGDWVDKGFYVKPFARLLAPFQPLVAVAPHGMDGEKVPGTIEEMAQDRLPEILDYRPQGPYRLGGHCAGAMVALETARLLVSMGHEVEFVVLIDPIWTAAGEPYPVLEGATIGGNVMLLPDADSESAEPVKYSLTEGPVETDQRYAEAHSKYRPLPVSLPVILFAAAYDGRPWRQISDDFELVEHVGDHYDWITSRAPEFVAHLRAYVGARRREPGLEENSALSSPAVINSGE